MKATLPQGNWQEIVSEMCARAYIDGQRDIVLSMREAAQSPEAQASNGPVLTRWFTQVLDKVASDIQTSPMTSAFIERAKAMGREVGEA